MFAGIGRIEAVTRWRFHANFPLEKHFQDRVKVLQHQSQDLVTEVQTRPDQGELRPVSDHPALIGRPQGGGVGGGVC